MKIITFLWNQKLNDEHIDNLSLIGFGTFKVDNSRVIINALKIGYRHLDLAENYKKSKNEGKNVGSIFFYRQSSQWSSRERNDKNDESFVASQGVVFCATCKSVNDEDYPADAEGIFQPSRFAVFYPLPPESSPEGTWREYFMDHRNLIDRNFRSSWLVYKNENYTWNHLPGGSIIYESTVSESENGARWQADNIIRIEHSMLQFFQPEDYRVVLHLLQYEPTDQYSNNEDYLETEK